MIIGLGSDIIDIRRVEKAHKKSGDKFFERIFTAKEIKAGVKFKNSKKRYAYFAKRFAAKEAVAKALGTGVGENINFTEAEISTLPTGKPVLKLTGSAAKTLKKLTPQKMKAQIDVSLSDDYPYAMAVVIISSY